MRFRRRYEVVVEGVAGQAAAQRAVISEHRTEAEAREAAAVERSRLEVIHGAGARAWRILVVREGRAVAEERPSAEGEDLLEGLGAGAEAAPSEPRPDREPGPEPQEPAAAEPDPAEPGTASRYDEVDDPPEGPVPDWVIRRFEESIARRGDREAAPEPDE